MSLMMREGFASALDTALRLAIHNYTKRKTQVVPLVFNVLSSSKALEYDRTFTGFSGVPVKPEGERVQFDDMKQGYLNLYVHVSYGLGAKVTHEMLQDDQHGVMSRIPTNLAIAMTKTTESVGANVFNDGFTTIYGDGVPLFSNAHPLRKAGGTWSNHLGNVDLGYSAIQEAILNIENQVDDAGIPLNRKAKILLIHPKNKFNAKKFFNSELEPDTSNNNVNVIKDEGIKVITWSYLTNEDAWFMLSDEHQLNFFYREKPNTTTDIDKIAKCAITLIYARMSAGCSDARGTCGSPGQLI